MGILPSVTRPSSVFRVWAWVRGYHCSLLAAGTGNNLVTIITSEYSILSRFVGVLLDLEAYGAGFSTEVDRQLMQAANFTSCPEWHKLVIINFDEELEWRKFRALTVVSAHPLSTTSTVICGEYQRQAMNHFHVRKLIARLREVVEKKRSPEKAHCCYIVR